MELRLELTTNTVLVMKSPVNNEGVEELKRIVKIKGVKKEKKPPYQLGRTLGSIQWQDILKMEMEIGNPSSEMSSKISGNVQDTTYTCYDAMKDLIKVSKLPQTLMSCILHKCTRWRSINMTL
ncbi:hypothetical protein Tco_0895876 [Tanacetum coccineum]|uniref:Uncharacterized protein n=1 Tax=Tanacetum coccineum TaxID=301880 RepID=A0ABQ5CH16_9ASTR